MLGNFMTISPPQSRIVWFGNSIYTSFKIKNIVDLKINKVTYHIAETKEDYDMTQHLKSALIPYCSLMRTR